MTAIKYRTADVGGFNIFYREAGAPDAPKLLLLHGFPSASHMFRDLIPLLVDRFHMIAPDLPGFGKSDMPGRGCTFDQIAQIIDRFTEVVGFDRYAVYVFDYGAPTGFRLAVKHPERITAIISQNGNAYRGRPERRLEPDPGLLGRRIADQPGRTPRLLGARDDRLAIHARRSRRDGGLSRWLLARQFLPGPARRG